MAIQDRLRKFLTKNTVDIGQALVSLRYPGIVLPVDLTTAGVKVGASNVIKIHVSADTYVAFSDDSAMLAVTVTTSPAVMLPAGMHYVLCAGEYVRTSANPTRIELLKV
jgi:hypothetical protein